MKDQKVESVNNIPANNQLNFLERYIWDRKVNGQEIKFWRDVICQKYIEPKDFSAEHVRIKQPLSLELMCLPLAIVKLSGDFGTKTKAAICRNRSDDNTYLLGNRTVALIRVKNNFECFPLQSINMVQIRSQI